MCTKWVPKLWMLSEKVRIFDKTMWVKSEWVKSEWAKSEWAKSEWAKSEGAKSEWAKSEWAKSEFPQITVSSMELFLEWVLNTLMCSPVCVQGLNNSLFFQCSGTKRLTQAKCSSNCSHKVLSNSCQNFFKGNSPTYAPLMGITFLPLVKGFSQRNTLLVVSEPESLQECFFAKILES